MNTQDKMTEKGLFGEHEVNWGELAGIGIQKEDIESKGDMDKFLNGQKTEVISLNLTILGVDIVLDATLQLVEDNQVGILEICGANNH